MFVNVRDLVGAFAGRPDQEGALDGRLDLDQLFDAGSL
jgi:hypothetical protein